MFCRSFQRFAVRVSSGTEDQTARATRSRRRRAVRSKATSLVNLEGGYRLTKSLRLNLEVFNLFSAADSDIDYFYVSRLPGEPADGVADVHTHPTIPRTARVSLHVGF